MLTKLYIQNFVIIDKIEVSFCSGLNIIIGETGAGKSIVVDALMLLFGEKASADLVRQNTNKAIIEAHFIFESKSVFIEKLKNNNFDVESNEVIIRREIPLKGNSRCFINDTPITLAGLKDFCKNLVDFHGQNDHQSLLEKDKQLLILDYLIDDKNIILNYNNCFDIYQNIISDYKQLTDKRKFYMQQADLFAIQKDEIDDVIPKLDEDILIENELKLLENSENLFTITEDFSQLVENDQYSVKQNLVECEKKLNELHKFDAVFEPYISELKTALISINETENFVKAYKNNISFNPKRIEELRERYAKVNRLKKKYGSIKDILELREKLEKDLELVENYDDRLNDLKRKLVEIREKLSALAISLNEKRRKIAKYLEQKIVEELAKLGIENAIFEVKFSSETTSENDANNFSIPTIIANNQYIKTTNTGIDNVEFHIATNKGEPLTSLAVAASGGEISRIMLAMKSIIAAADKTPILIFDEIDTGISGRIAQKVGFAMKELAKFHQIIAITHLPQIAAMGDANILISKSEVDNRITTIANELGAEEKIIEIAKMFSGEELSDSAIESAKKLIFFN